MKTKISIFCMMFMLTSMFYACNESTDEMIQTQNPEIEYKTLTSSEIVLKNQLADAAMIVAEIATDQSVLDEIVATIKIQPRIMEDRVKFADIMNPKQQLKSVKIEIKTGKFAAAFKNQLKESGLKSASTLIEELAAKGVEVYIPYPIEDYPKGTDVVVTSTPLDNEYENIGYIVGNTKKTVLANQKLTEKKPVIIITPSVVSVEEIAKTASINNSKSNLKSINIDPMSVWDNTAYTFTIFLDYVYIKNDYVEGLFQPEGQIHYCSGGVSFDSSNSSITNKTTSEENHSSQRFPRKFEGYARNGYVKGMFPLDQRQILDWHPGITSISFGWFMDLPKKTNSKSLTLSAGLKAELTVPLPPLNLLLKPEGSIAQTLTKTLEFGDHLYDNKVWPRYMYKQLYTVSDNWSQVHGNGWVQLANGNWAPVRKATNECFYVSHCEVGVR
jgi:hypothetical protein